MRLIIFVLISFSFLFSNQNTKWSYPLAISREDSSSKKPSTAIDNTSKVITVFEDFFNIQAAYSLDGGEKWQLTNKFLSKNSSATNPIVLFDNNSRAICIWENQNYYTSVQCINASYSDNFGRTWKSAARPLSNANNISLTPYLTFDKNNIAICVWQEKVDSRISIIRSASSINGGITWSQIRNVSLIDSKVRKPKLFVGENNTLICLYEKKEGSSSKLISSTSTDRGKKWQISASSIEEKNAQIVDYQAMIDKKGNVVCIYQTKNTESEKKVIYCAISENYGKSWQPPQVITKNKSCSSFAMDINENNKYLIIWSENIQNKRKALSAYSIDEGKGWVFSDNYIGETNAHYPKMKLKFYDKDSAICLRCSYDKIADKLCIKSSFSLDGGLSWNNLRFPIPPSNTKSYYCNLCIFKNNYKTALSVFNSLDNSGSEKVHKIYSSNCILPISLHFKGKVISESSYLVLKKYFADLKWDKYQKNTIYRIYRNSKEAKHIIYEGPENTYFDNEPPSNLPYNYLLTYFDENNEESAPMKIKLNIE